MSKIKDAAKAIAALMRARGLSVEDGCKALVFTLVVACRAGGGTKADILAWVADQIDLCERERN